MTVTVNLNNAAGTGNTAYTEQTPVNLFADAVLTATSSDDNAVDVVTVTITGATATESLALSASAASLAFTNGVTAAYNTETGVLTLTGSNETNITWTNILKGIRYNDTNDNPASARTVTVNARNNATGNQSNDTHVINVTGVDDAPTGDILAASVNEDTTLTGNLTAIDVDGGPAVYSLVGTVPAGFTLLSPGGDYSFDASNAAYQSLANGDILNVFVNYEVGDDLSSGTLAITVTGTNDGPIADVILDEAIEDGDALTGSLTSTDVDAGATAAYSILLEDGELAPAGFTLEADGSYTFNPTDAAYQNLADGDILNVVVNYEVTDGIATSQGSLTITVTGTNDAPVAAVLTAAATENGDALTGNLTSTDADADAEATYSIVLGEGELAPAGFELAENGGYTFDSTNAAYNSIADGDTLDVVVNYEVSDGIDTDAGSLTITVTGTNDAPVADTLTANATEDGATLTGSLTSTDVDAGATAAYSILLGAEDSPSAPAGFTLLADGSYTFDPTNEAYQSLAAGDILDVVVNYEVTDGFATNQSTLTITVTGTNDAPVAAVLSAAAIEDSAVINGSLTSTDVDGDVDTVYTYTVVGDAPAGFALLADGSYTFDPTGEAYQNIAEGETSNVIVNYEVSDGSDAGAGTLTIAVTGTNDNPIVDVIEPISVSEDGAALVGNVTSTDIDNAATATYSILLGEDEVIPAGFTLLPDGSYTFDRTDAAYQSLADDDTLDVVVNYEVTDGLATDQGSLTITVTGTNDAPVAAVLTAAATENGDALTGNLTSTDADADAEATYSIVLGEGELAPAGFELAENGGYTFDPTNAAYNSIADGDTLDVVVNYEVSDGIDTDAGSLTITVTGTNDAPVADTLTADATEDGDALTGSLTSTDVDAGDTATYSILLGEGESVPAGFELAEDGSYTFDPTDIAYQSLADDQTLDVVVDYEVTDGIATSQGSLTITVTGTNDAPVAAVLTAAAIEGDENVLNGNLTSTDADAEATATYSIVLGEGELAPAGFELAENGGYTFDPTNAAYNSIADGDTLDVVVNYEVSDGIDTGAGSLTITVTGTNDSPVAAVLAAAATEDGDPLIGNLTSTDVDTGDTATYSILGESAPAGFTLLADGSYSFDPTDATYQSLADGDTLDVVVNYEVTDGLATDQGSLTITVTGTNDVPIAGILIAAVNEDGDALTGDLTSTDADAGAEATYTLTDASVPAGFTLGEDGSSYTFDPTDEAYQSLAEDDTLDVIVNYEVSDGIDTSAGSLTITVTGTNDDPTGSSTYIQPTINENAPYTITVAQLLEGFSDVDAGQTATLSIENLTSPQGTFTLSGSTYTFVPENADYFGTVDLSYDVEDVDGGVFGATTSFTINPINDAPTTTVSSVSLAGINEDATVNPGATVASLFGSVFSDAKDAPASDAFIGVAIVNQITNVSQGAWEWLDTSNGWQPINSVSTAGALFLDAATRVRFVPAANFNGVPSPLQARLVETGARNSFNNPVITGDLLNVSGANSGGTTRVSNLSNTVTLSTVVNPIDDPTTITGDTAGTVTEDTDINFSGSLVATDADVSGPLFTPVANQDGTYGKFTILSNGTWQYNLANDNPLVQHLGAADSLNDTYTFNTVTGASQVVNVTINGSIDAGVSITGTNADEVIDGKDGNDVLSGGLGNDSIFGGLGNDVLVGTGDSTGLDTFAGGQGDDIYGIYSPDTTITENVNEGNDTVWTSVGYTLAENVENLYVVGALTGIGNSGDNLIVGFGEDNQTLEGLAGNDTLYGGAGDDTLNGGVGNDFLDGGAGTDILLGSGDTTGLDTFAGGAGDDVYGVYSTATTIIENANEGNDSVWTAVDYTLTDNIENLYLVGEISGTGNGGDNTIVGFGTDDHTISGGAGNDTLAGASGVDMIDGGAGTDVISGGEGADIFTFLFTQSTATATDRITDFEIGVDKFEIFGAVPSSFSRALDDSTSIDLSSLVAGVYAGGLTAGAAALVVSTGSIAGTYVVIDDGVAGFNAADDLVINITGASGALPTNPASVSSFFKV